MNQCSGCLGDALEVVRIKTLLTVFQSSRVKRRRRARRSGPPREVRRRRRRRHRRRSRRELAGTGDGRRDGHRHRERDATNGSNRHTRRHTNVELLMLHGSSVTASASRESFKAAGVTQILVSRVRNHPLLDE